MLEATGSIFTNKYAEGYPGARYYAGNEIVDELENLAIERLKALFGTEHANVQPYSGSPANQAVYRAILSPGDKVMGLPIPDGGHLTHGWAVNFSGTDYQRVPYGLHEKTQQIDYDRLRETAKRERPKLIWVGGTAYPRAFDYAAMAEIALMSLGRRWGFLEDPGSEASREDYSFYYWLHFWLSGRCRLASRQDCSAGAAGRTGLNRNCRPYR